MSNQSPILKLTDICKSFNEGPQALEILKGVALEVQHGQKAAIVGQSGCGKSTLLQIAGLLDKPTKGEIFVNGKRADNLSDRKKAALRNEAFGFVYQYHHLLAEFTALENVMMPGMISRHFTSKQASQRAQELLEKVGLSPRAKHYPAELSGGEQQRVALARALMNKPKLLLADEPTGNLDPENAERVFQLFQTLITEEDLSVLMVTHNEMLAGKCDIAWRMSGGKLVKA